VAMLVAIPYMGLNLVVLLRGLVEILLHPDLITGWRAALHVHGDFPALLLASAIIFPKLALGLSGFETGVSVMPIVEGEPGDETAPLPRGRLRPTPRLLLPPPP